MAVRSSQAEWTGTLREGEGRMRIGHDTVQRPYTFASRFEEAKGSNPEELVAAAHAGCYSMALSGGLTRAGHTPKRIHTVAKVHLQPTTAGQTVTKIELVTEAEVPGISDADFQKAAADARENCPISRLVKASAEITLRAKLV